MPTPVLQLPPRVRHGDTVAIVSPSWHAAGSFSHRVERGRAYLEALGLRVRIMPNACVVGEWTAGTPRQRVDDLHAAFTDPDVRVVLCAIGGNHANELLELLDYDLVAANPKVFQGLSDITVLHAAFARHAGLATFYGPAFVTNLAEYPEVPALTNRSLRAAWFGDAPLAHEPATEWTDEFLDFAVQADLTRARATKPGAGWTWLREGVATGPVTGGCLETLCWHVKGSTEWPDLEGAILLLETSELAPSPGEVAAYLTDLRRLGVFDQIVGLVFARPANYRGDAVARLWRVVSDAVGDRDVPILANVDVGHTDPMLTVPLGVPAVLDSKTSTFRTLDAPTADRP
ncbi:MAG: LD-carboxypeptidase [Actinobacteria bacterium]|nr:LD-carboxypeptidase [Actinomycetota bacterium]